MHENNSLSLRTKQSYIDEVENIIRDNLKGEGKVVRGPLLLVDSQSFSYYLQVSVLKFPDPSITNADKLPGRRISELIRDGQQVDLNTQNLNNLLLFEKNKIKIRLNIKSNLIMKFIERIIKQGINFNFITSFKFLTEDNYHYSEAPNFVFYIDSSNEVIDTQETLKRANVIANQVRDIIIEMESEFGEGQVENHAKGLPRNSKPIYSQEDKFSSTISISVGNTHVKNYLEEHGILDKYYDRELNNYK